MDRRNSIAHTQFLIVQNSHVSNVLFLFSDWEMRYHEISPEKLHRLRFCHRKELTKRLPEGVCKLKVHYDAPEMTFQRVAKIKRRVPQQI